MAISTVENIARQLVNGDGTAAFRHEMCEMFLENPSYMDDVPPLLRGRLQTLLDMHRAHAERMTRARQEADQTDWNQYRR